VDAVADHYLVEKVATATPAELIALLYDKAVLSLTRAQAFLAAGDNRRAFERLANATDVVLELRSILNPAAGDMTVRLEALYAWVTGRLLLATSHKDPAMVQEALDVLVPLRSAWREACVVGAAAPAGVPAQR
jgi:flagellar protein FliS